MGFPNFRCFREGALVRILSRLRFVIATVDSNFDYCTTGKGISETVGRFGLQGEKIARQRAVHDTMRFDFYT